MTDKLKNFLKQQEVKDLLNANKWEELFLLSQGKIAPGDRKELYQMAKQAFGEIKVQNEGTYYSLIQLGDKSQYLLQVTKPYRNSNTKFDYGWTSNVNLTDNQVVIKVTNGYDEALSQVMEMFNGSTIPIRVEDENDQNYVNIELYGYERENFYITRECYNQFDPSVKREENIRQAAISEYSNEIKPLMKSFIKNEDQLIREIEELMGDQYTGYIFLRQVVDKWVISCSNKYDYKLQWEDLKKIILKHFKHVDKVYPSADYVRVYVTFKNSKLQEIKKEVEDHFEIQF